MLGGRSDIGLEIAVRLAPGRDVVLAARRPDDLVKEAARVTAAGARSVTTVEFDADDLASHEQFVANIVERHGPIGTAVLAFGILGDQARAETDAAHAVAVVHTDYVAQVSMLTHLATALRAQTSGRIVVFSSVAGARVRRANYVYGSAKAGLDGFASGLADALHGSGVRLVLIRPGFVIGRMTEGMSPAPMSSTPGQVADAVAGALKSGKDVVWVPGRLRPVFFVMRLLPRAVWRRMPR
ncbi:MAG: SDR family NAD(P)-dependent oxidoreductase [Rhodococcus sp. (in: high G+C Gram-positive bacteria)]